MNTAITRHYKSVPVDKTDIRLDKEKMRSAVFALLCLYPGMKATLDQLAGRFKDYERWKIKARLMELCSKGYVEILPKAENGCMVYQVCTKGETK